MTMPHTCRGIALMAVFYLGGCSPGSEANAAPATAAGKDKTVATLVKSCLGCHAQAVSLADIPASEMPGAIKSVISGEVGHPTVVPKLTDEQIAELAKLLQQP